MTIWILDRNWEDEGAALTQRVLGAAFKNKDYPVVVFLRSPGGHPPCPGCANRAPWPETLVRPLSDWANHYESRCPKLASGRPQRVFVGHKSDRGFEYGVTITDDVLRIRKWPAAAPIENWSDPDLISQDGCWVGPPYWETLKRLNVPERLWTKKDAVCRSLTPESMTDDPPHGSRQVIEGVLRYRSDVPHWFLDMPDGRRLSRTNLSCRRSKY